MHVSILVPMHVHNINVATPLLEECEDDTHTPEMGLGSPPGLSKFQSSIVGVKTPCLEVFFMSLESY
jgi:hypothetical protein